MTKPVQPLRLAFMGTPDFAVPVLDALVAAGHGVAMVYSQPPRPTGRGHRTQNSPVHQRALALGLTVRHPANLRGPADTAAFAKLGLDAAVVAAYGLILPVPVLDAPRLGCLNVHASLLPRWRGAAPIQRALLAGDDVTGVTIMQMDQGLDTGAMLLRQELPITQDSTAATLTHALAEAGARLIVEALAGVAAGHLTGIPQPGDGVTYATKLTRPEAALDWRQPAELALRKVRALNPWPGVWFELNGERIKVLAADLDGATDAAPGQVVDDDLGIACAGMVFRPRLMQRPGRGPVERRAFLNGLPVPRFTVLPCPATS